MLPATEVAECTCLLHTCPGEATTAPSTLLCSFCGGFLAKSVRPILLHPKHEPSAWTWPELSVSLAGGSGWGGWRVDGSLMPMLSAEPRRARPWTCRPHCADGGTWGVAGLEVALLGPGGAVTGVLGRPPFWFPHPFFAEAGHLLQGLMPPWSSRLLPAPSRRLSHPGPGSRSPSSPTPTAPQCHVGSHPELPT